MSEIPTLPHSYTSDPHLNSFMHLLTQGLSDIPSDRPSIESYNNHPFLLSKPGLRSIIDIDEDDGDYLEIIGTLASGDYVKLRKVKLEVNNRLGYMLPPHI